MNVDRVSGSISDEPLSTHLRLPIGLRDARTVSRESLLALSDRPSRAHFLGHGAGLSEMQSGVQAVQEQMQEGSILH